MRSGYIDHEGFSLERTYLYHGIHPYVFKIWLLFAVIGHAAFIELARSMLWAASIHNLRRCTKLVHENTIFRDIWCTRGFALSKHTMQQVLNQHHHRVVGAKSSTKNSSMSANAMMNTRVFISGSNRSCKVRKDRVLFASSTV